MNTTITLLVLIETEAASKLGMGITLEIAVYQTNNQDHGARSEAYCQSSTQGYSMPRIGMCWSRRQSGGWLMIRRCLTRTGLSSGMRDRGCTTAWPNW